MAYCLLCHYRRKHVFAEENADYIISIVVVVAIQLKLEEKKRTAKYIIIKVNYTIHDAFEEKASMPKSEKKKKKTSNKFQYERKRENQRDDLSFKTNSERKVVLSFSFDALLLNRSIDLNKR